MKDLGKMRKIAFLGLSIACVLAIVTCLICDLAINKAITWSLYTLYSVPFFWLLMLPLVLLKRHQLLFTLITFTVGALPYLYLLSGITPVTGWYATLGMPVALSCLFALWLSYAVFRFLPVNVFYKSAIALALFGIGVNLIVDVSLAGLRATPLLWWESALDIAIIILATVFLGFIGYRVDHKKTQSDQ